MLFVAKPKGPHHTDVILGASGPAGSQPADHPQIGPVLSALKDGSPIEQLIHTGRYKGYDLDRLRGLAKSLEGHEVERIQEVVTGIGPRLLVRLRAVDS